MSWGITKVGAPPSAVAEAFRQRVNKEQGYAHNTAAKGILEAHAVAVESFVSGLTLPDTPGYPRSLIVESSGHVEASAGSFKLEARVVY